MPTRPHFTFQPATSEEQLGHIRDLFHEYADAIGVDLEYQGFAAELASLEKHYELPRGALILATHDGQPAGCVALRPLDHEIAELKRLYVRPAFRRNGVARQLVEAAIDTARTAGFVKLRLDTLADMHAAQRLYQLLGFIEIPAYNQSHLGGTKFFEKTLRD